MSKMTRKTMMTLSRMKKEEKQRGMKRMLYVK